MKMTRTELNEREMMMANGGCDDYVETEESICHRTGIHYGCGGHISGKMNPFVSCTCDKCGETHYFYDDFFPSDWSGDYEEF